MDAATIQGKIYAGYAKVALRLGLAYQQYRPSLAANPLSTARASLYASFNAEDFKYGKPNKYGDPLWYGVFDGSTTLPGDYLVGPGGTFFIAAQQLNLPILMVECNRQVRLLRVSAPSGVGAVGYSGQCATDSTDALGAGGANGSFGTGWPASILQGGRAEATGTGLPTTNKNAAWKILLPVSVPITMNASDILLDDLGRRYVVQGAELTDLGWRMQAVEEHA